MLALFLLILALGGIWLTLQIGLGSILVLLIALFVLSGAFLLLKKALAPSFSQLHPTEVRWILWITVVGVVLVCSMFFLSKAHAQMNLPPVEFDKPYPGKLTVEIVTKDQLRTQCAAATLSSLGCAFPGKDSCRIILVDEATMRAVGWTVEAMLRHERAHCNGWPQAHPGMRPYQPK